MSFFQSSSTSSSEEPVSSSTSEDAEIKAYREFDLGAPLRTLDCGTCGKGKGKGKKSTSAPVVTSGFTDKKKEMLSLPPLDGMVSGEEGEKLVARYVKKKETPHHKIKGVFLPEVTPLKSEWSVTLDAWYKRKGKTPTTPTSSIFANLVLPETREIDARHRKKSLSPRRPRYGEELTPVETVYGRKKSRSRSPRRCGENAELGRKKSRSRSPRRLAGDLGRKKSRSRSPRRPHYGEDLGRKKSRSRSRSHSPRRLAGELGRKKSRSRSRSHSPRRLAGDLGRKKSRSRSRSHSPRRLAGDLGRKKSRSRSRSHSPRRLAGDLGRKKSRSPHRRHYGEDLDLGKKKSRSRSPHNRRLHAELDADLGRRRRHYGEEAYWPENWGEDSHLSTLLDDMKSYVAKTYPAETIQPSDIKAVRASMDKSFQEAVSRIPSLAGEFHNSKKNVDGLFNEAEKKSLSVEPPCLTTMKASRQNLNDLFSQMESKYGNLDTLSCCSGKKGRKNMKASDPLLNATSSDYGTSAMENTTAKRLATTLTYASKMPDGALRGMLLNGKSTNLAGIMGKSKDTTVAKHLAHSHTPLYNLLKDNGLLEKLTSVADLVVIVPDPAVLEGITNRVSDETRDMLLYHLIVVPVAQPIKTVTSMMEYATLNGENKVQVENREGAYFINGHHMKSDIVFRTNIYHIEGLLSPTQTTETTTEVTEKVVPPMNAPEEKKAEKGDSTTTEESGSSTEGSETGSSEADVPAPTHTPPTMAGTEHVLTMLPMAAFAMKSVGQGTTYKNSVVETLVAKMNTSYYLASLDMKSHLDTTYAPLESATITLRTYNPTPLYGEYSSRRMKDISRIQQESVAQEIVFLPIQQKRLDIGNKSSVTQYSLNSNDPRANCVAIKKADLLSGLTQLSVPSPGALGGKVCIILCGIKATESDPNTYMTEDENLLLRFKNNLLDTITVNHGLRMPLSTADHGGNHFLELFTTVEERKALYRRALSKEEFNAMLLSASKVGKYVKKKVAQAGKNVRKAAGKAGRKVVSRAGREKKRATAMRTKTVSITNIPVDKFAEQEASQTPAEEKVTIKVFDKNVKLLDDLSIANASAKRYNYKVGSDQFKGYLVEEDNTLGTNLGRGRTGVSMDVVTPLRSMSFNMSAVTISDGNAYYAEKDGTIFMLLFSGQKLERLLILPRKSSWVSNWKL